MSIRLPLALIPLMAMSCSHDSVERFEFEEDGFLGFECLSAYCDWQVDCLEAGQITDENGVPGVGIANSCENDLLFDAYTWEALATSFWVEDTEGRLDLGVRFAQGGEIGPDSTVSFAAGQQIESYFDGTPFNSRFAECVDGRPVATSSPDQEITIAVLLPHPVIDGRDIQPEPPLDVPRDSYPGCPDEWREYSSTGPFIRSYARVPFR